jgi:hypothetical protein
VTRRLGGAAAVLAFFTACLVIVTWPQARVFATRAVAHQDVYFNLWRLKWIAHAARQPLHLFDTNIFYPERRTLALSDAMLVEGAVAAPMLWAGVRDILVHNLLLFGAMVASGGAMFLLVGRLTGSRGAGLLAGLVFAFAPYRMEHLMHMELQWAMWSPLALLALHDAIDSGRARWGIATGLLVALQTLSCIYYGVYLGTLLVVCGALLLAADRGAAFRRSIAPLAAGAVVAAVLCGAYAVPYLRVRATTGERSIEEVVAFGARPSSYLAATPDNRLYGGERPSRAERRLFPGLVPILLALIGLLLRPPARWQIVSLVGLGAAFEMSLGLGGYSYSFLYDHLAVFRGLRASARLGLFVLLFLGILAGYGYASVVARAKPAVRVTVFALLAAAILTEYSVSPGLVDYAGPSSRVDRFLSDLPRGVVVEFPFPDPGRLPGDDPYYAYQSTAHFYPLVNGYSGVYPKTYLARGARLQHFPDATSIEQIRRDDVTYVVVHEFGEREIAMGEAAVQSGRFTELGSFTEDGHRVTLFKFH